MVKRGRRQGKYRQATRLLLLLEYLRSRRFGATLTELAEEFEITERQIRRDLEALDEAGHSAELSLTTDGRTRVHLPGVRSRSVPLTLRERYVLLAVRRVFDVLADTPFHEDVRSIYSKIAGSLPDDQRADLDTFGERFLFVPAGGTKAYAGKQDILDGLLTGVIHRLRVRYRYRAADGEIRSGVLEPYAMTFYKHGLYVIGCSMPDGKEATKSATLVYAAERFEEAEHVRGSHFEVPPSFRLDEFFQGTFGIFLGGKPQRVVIDFAKEVRTRIEARTWHGTQELKPLRGGGVRLTFEASNLTQVTPWILEWGPMARVREPAVLVEEVTRKLREAGAQYG